MPTMSPQKRTTTTAAVLEYMEAVHPEVQSAATLALNLGLPPSHVRAALTDLRHAGWVDPTLRGHGAQPPRLTYAVEVVRHGGAGRQIEAIGVRQGSVACTTAHRVRIGWSRGPR